jgi:hypothetical protein
MGKFAGFAVVVVTLAGCSANDDLPAPQIASITPGHGAPASVVVINGAYFCHQPANEDPLACANMGVVAFGASAGVPSQYSDNTIMAEVPNGVGTVEVVVTVAAETSNAVAFTID